MNHQISDDRQSSNMSLFPSLSQFGVFKGINIIFSAFSLLFYYFIDKMLFSASSYTFAFVLVHFCLLKYAKVVRIFAVILIMLSEQGEAFDILSPHHYRLYKA